jgi:hypothetical protein
VKVRCKSVWLLHLLLLHRRSVWPWQLDNLTVVRVGLPSGRAPRGTGRSARCERTHVAHRFDLSSAQTADCKGD